jgi:thiol-disulfide isomerase/thioredoxin
VPRPSRIGLIAALALAPAFGCGELPNLQATSVHQTPESVLEPKAPAEPKSAPASSSPKPKDEAPAKDANAKKAAPVKSAAVTPKFRTVALAGDDAAKDTGKDKAKGESEAAAITLTMIKIDDLLGKIAANKTAKYTIVDVWSTTCPPCMENFPHVVAMHKKHGPKGLSVLSLSTDDPEDAKTLDRARAFLKKQGATTTNYVDAEYQSAFEKFAFNAIPAVLLFGPDGKMLRKYTWDDPYNQFTYEQVESDVRAIMDGKPLPPPPKRKTEKG